MAVPNAFTKTLSRLPLRLYARLGRVSGKRMRKLDDDVEERTTSMGLFNTADAYRLSAIKLRAGKRVKSGHADTPIRLLYYHALELYLKALLRLKHSVKTLREKFGHNIPRLMKEAEALGLPFMDEDRTVFTIIWETDAINEARYIRIGPKTFVTFEALDRTCDSIRESVAAILRKEGLMVRL
jgi:hypothetical protein